MRLKRPSIISFSACVREETVSGCSCDSPAMSVDENVAPNRPFRVAIGVDADGKDGADCEKRADEVRAPVAEERQRHALRGQRLADDAEVEHGLEEDDERHADHEEASEPGGGLARDVDRQREKRREKK